MTFDFETKVDQHSLIMVALALAIVGAFIILIAKLASR